MPLPPASVSERVGAIPASAGIGLRALHHREVMENRPDIAWFEVHTENYMGGGMPLRQLEAIRRDYPIALHSVGLSLGSADGIDAAHLERVRQVAERVAPGLVSDHLSWSASEGTYLGDLLPLPLTEEALHIVCRSVERFQDHLKCRVLVENPSSYLRYRHSTIPEWEFLAAVADLRERLEPRLEPVELSGRAAGRRNRRDPPRRPHAQILEGRGQHSHR